MRICMDAVRLFFGYLRGEASAADVMRHPAYRAISGHIATFHGVRASGLELECAIRGEPSPIYGLSGLSNNRARIERLLANIESNAAVWTTQADAALERVFPGEHLDDLTVYPVIGYDMGIGQNGIVAMNLNTEQYLSKPAEFFYYMIHEACHVVHSRRSPIPDLTATTAPAWAGIMNYMTQYEGLAVYAALPVRAQYPDGLFERDYAVLCDPAAIGERIEMHRRARLALASGDEMTKDERMALVFGLDRLTYRVGAELFRLIEEEHGLAGLQKAAVMPPALFWAKFSALLDRVSPPGA